MSPRPALERTADGKHATQWQRSFPRCSANHTGIRSRLRRGRMRARPFPSSSRFRKETACPLMPSSIVADGTLDVVVVASRLRGGASGGYNYDDDDYYGGPAGEEPYYDDGGWGQDARGRGGRNDRNDPYYDRKGSRRGRGTGVGGFDLRGTITRGNKSEPRGSPFGVHVSRSYPVDFRVLNRFGREACFSFDHAADLW